MTTTPTITAAPAELDAAARFAQLPAAEPLGEYNFEHFTTKHLVRDARRTVQIAGIKPGERAPDFVLPSAGGGTLRLADLRGRPVVLHFGSFS